MAMKAHELGIQRPCTLDWQKMTPAQGGRFCGDCKKVVRDLSTLTEAEARALVAKGRYGDLCVRMLVDRDGNVFFGGGSLVSASLLSRAKRAAAAAAAIALPLGAQACTAVTEPLGMSSEQNAPNEDPDHGELMGGISSEDPRMVPHDPDASDGSADAATQADAQGDAQADASPDAAAKAADAATPDDDSDDCESERPADGGTGEPGRDGGDDPRIP